MKNVLIATLTVLSILAIPSVYAHETATIVNTTSCHCLGDPNMEIFKPICKINNEKAINIDVRSSFESNGNSLAPGASGLVNLLAIPDYPYPAAILASGGSFRTTIPFYGARPNNTYYVVSYTTKFGGDYLVIKYAPKC